MILAGTSIMDTFCDIQRARLVQDETRATDYNFDNPIVVAPQVPFAIQSAKPTDVELFSQRDVVISHKLYTTDTSAALSQLGDRIADTRFSPPRYYIVKAPPEDMAGRGLMWGFFAWLQQ